MQSYGMELIRDTAEFVAEQGAHNLVGIMGIPPTELVPYLIEKGGELANFVMESQPDIPLEKMIATGMLHGFLVGWIAASNLDDGVAWILERKPPDDVS